MTILKVSVSEFTILCLECSQLTLASAIIARGSSAGCGFGPLLAAPYEGSRKPDIGHPTKVAKKSIQ